MCPSFLCCNEREHVLILFHSKSIYCHPLLLSKCQRRRGGRDLKRKIFAITRNYFAYKDEFFSGKNLFHLISQRKSNRKEILSNSLKDASRFILPNISDLAKVILTETQLFPSNYSLHSLQVWGSVHQTITAARQTSQDLRLGPLSNPVLRRLLSIQTYEVA